MYTITKKSTFVKNAFSSQYEMAIRTLFQKILIDISRVYSICPKTKIDHLKKYLQKGHHKKTVRVCSIQLPHTNSIKTCHFWYWDNIMGKVLV